MTISAAIRTGLDVELLCSMCARSIYTLFFEQPMSYLCIEHYLIHLLELRSFYFLHQPEMEIFLFHILHFSATGYFK